ncbi:MAG: thymidine phosphorylase, partial [Anaerotignaceae bacterium]
EDGKKLLLENIENGKGLAKLRELIIQQGGNPNVIEDYSIFGMSKNEMFVKATKAGYVAKMDTALIGKASVQTGAGRKTKADKLDYTAGIVMAKRIGDKVEKGEILATIFADSQKQCEIANKYLEQAIIIEENKPEPPKLILEII